ncbi:MAG TPA: TetR/AcrR family transcriptional regulator [Trebonia sp.]|nr:TetR/AcrR family transcriptional regulator [Trebonia sp.]
MAETRAVLIEAAVDTLRESGFAAASARRIAQRAGCNQALVFYHFGSVNDLLVAALEDVSSRRMDAYRELLSHTESLAALAESARVVFEQDLDAGHVRVLTEMISGAQSVPGLAERVAACLAPWRAFAEDAVRDVLAASPVPGLFPPQEVAHAVVAGILGLEMLASLDADAASVGASPAGGTARESGRAAALALFDRAHAVGELLDRLRPLAGLLDLTSLVKDK